MNDMDRIKVIDSPCGFGKTSYAIQKINEYPDDVNILYITPFLEEVERIIESCPNKKFIQPESVKGKQSKRSHLISLINQQKNVCSTHALFQNMTDELINALRANNYVLFLDEAFQVLEYYNLFPEKHRLTDVQRERLTKQDVEWLLEDKYIKINEDFSVVWLDQKRVPIKYEDLKKMIDRKLVYIVHNSLFLWSFPYEVFDKGIFDEIYVMTYLWESQYQYYYYKYFNIEYTKYYVQKVNDRYEIFETKNNDYEIEWKKSIKDKIIVLDNPKLNKVGSYYDKGGHTYKSALSLTWYRENEKTPSIIRIKDNMDNFFRNLTQSDPNKRLWCCFKEFKPLLKSKGASAIHWLEISSRATNKWKERTFLSYTVNRYPNLNYQDFFKQKGIYVNQDAYAISDLIQWIFRSAIREGNPITIYLPSERMRNLLDYFLNDQKAENTEKMDSEQENIE
jgi:hypothetical protein